MDDHVCGRRRINCFIKLFNQRKVKNGWKERRGEERKGRRDGWISQQVYEEGHVESFLFHISIIISLD